MENGPVVGILSPFVGGDYYGALIAGITSAVAEIAGRVVAIQTLNPGSDSADASGIPDFRRPVSWGHVDGFVIIVGAVAESYVRSIRAWGKPVVLISHGVSESDCSAVIPDNQTGVREAVEHLIGHGHTRIGFAGYLTVPDIRERYEGYRSTLVANGLTVDPSLLFQAPDNHELGGAVAARAMIRAGLPSTAVLVGTDRNAIGLTRTLIADGYDVPNRQAVVGFDDITAARYVKPSLSSVRQPLGALGRAAVDLLIARLGGDARVVTRHVRTSFVPRESCGCPVSVLPNYLSRDQASEQFEDVSFLQSMLDTQYRLGIDLLRAHETDPRHLAWLRRTHVSAAVLGLWPAQAPAAASAAAEDDPRLPEGDGVLHIVGSFHRVPESESVPLAESVPRPRTSSRGLPGPPETATVSRFPPAGLFGLADERAGEVVFIVPVQSASRDWGFLAAVTGIQAKTPAGRELMNESGALLAVALDQDAMVTSLREQEDRLRRAALYDQLTGLPNRGLFLDRLERATKRSSRRPEYRFAVLFLDLDGFKQVNDTFGHAFGDRLLIDVAQRITGELRESDTAARFGGDEFLVLIDHVEDPRLLGRVVERLRAAVARPFGIDGRRVTISVSVGVAMSTTASGDAEALLREADHAMYAAKSRDKAGRSHPLVDSPQP